MDNSLVTKLNNFFINTWHTKKVLVIVVTLLVLALIIHPVIFWFFGSPFLFWYLIAKIRKSNPKLSKTWKSWLLVIPSYLVLVFILLIFVAINSTNSPKTDKQQVAGVTENTQEIRQKTEVIDKITQELKLEKVKTEELKTALEKQKTELNDLNQKFEQEKNESKKTIDQLNLKSEEMFKALESTKVTVAVPVIEQTDTFKNNILSSTAAPILKTRQQLPEPIQKDAGQDFVAGNCGDLKKIGLSRFRPGDTNYTSARDRDGDEIACE